MLLDNLPALQIVVPFLAAPLALLLRQRDLVWLLALVVSAVSFVIAVLLLQTAWAEGPIRYAMGGWQPPWGIEYYVDVANALILTLVAGISTLVLVFARASVAVEVGGRNLHLFYSAYLLCLTGLLGITITGDAFNVFVFLEISSLSTYALIAMGRDRRALTASYQYLIMGTVGATFIVIGIGLMYMMTGTLNMLDLAARLPAVADTRTVRVAFAFFAVGVSLKLALFPLHLWLPNAYAYAPSAVSAFLAATATKVAIYVLLRFFFTVFGHDFSFGAMPLTEILLVLALLGMFSGSISAIFQHNAKRILAYSSVAQVGYIILGIGLGTAYGVAAGILHLFNHALMKGALFLALGCVFYRVGTIRLEALRGLGKVMPWTMAALVIGGLSLIGVPLTAGFVSKWNLAMATVEAGLWPLAVLILLSSLLAVVYVWRIVEAAYFKEPLGDLTGVREAPLSLLLPTWTLAAANIYFGIDTSFSWGAAQAAAQGLLGVSP